MDVNVSKNDNLEEYAQHLALAEDFPQHLCKMCGKCCRAITTPYTHEELIQLANAGQEEAKVFVDLFKRYESIEAAKKVVPDHVEKVLEKLRAKPDFDESKVTFYYCPHVTDQNTCAIHPTRPDCCRRAPRNGWSVFPPGCGFEGWQFMQKERIKSTIRLLKEYLTELELMPDDYLIPERNVTVKDLRQTIEDRIKPWEKYGSALW